MASRELDRKLLKQIDPSAVKMYARATKWRRVEGDFDGIAVYRRVDDEDEELHIPEQRERPDFTSTMERAVLQFARIEDRLPVSVLNDLLLPPADVLRFKLKSSRAADGTIPLSDAVSLITSPRKALLASACTVIDPRPYYGRAMADAETFIEACRFGQTERGSFVTNFICPLEVIPPKDHILQGSLFSGSVDPPFTRKVTTNLMKSLNHIVESVRDDHAEKVTAPAEGSPQVSANLCEALLEMQPEEQRGLVVVSAQWSRVAPPEEPVPAKVEIPVRYFPAIHGLSQRLRPLDGPKEGTFIGKIRGLRGEPNKDGRMEGETDIRVVADEDDVMTIRVRLSPDDYAVACDAHKAASYVQVTGILQRAPRVHRIEGYKNFHRVGV